MCKWVQFVSVPPESRDDFARTADFRTLISLPVEDPPASPVSSRLFLPGTGLFSLGLLDDLLCALQSGLAHFSASPCGPCPLLGLERSRGWLCSVQGASLRAPGQHRSGGAVCPEVGSIAGQREAARPHWVGTELRGQADHAWCLVSHQAWRRPSGSSICGAAVLRPT